MIMRERQMRMRERDENGRQMRMRERDENGRQMIYPPACLSAALGAPTLVEEFYKYGKATTSILAIAQNSVVSDVS